MTTQKKTLFKALGLLAFGSSMLAGCYGGYYASPGYYNGGYYRARPGYYSAPRYYAPARPVYVAPARPVYYAPARPVYIR